MHKLGDNGVHASAHVTIANTGRVVRVVLQSRAKSSLVLGAVLQSPEFQALLDKHNLLVKERRFVAPAVPTCQRIAAILYGKRLFA